MWSKRRKYDILIFCLWFTRCPSRFRSMPFSPLCSIQAIRIEFQIKSNHILLIIYLTNNKKKRSSLLAMMNNRIGTQWKWDERALSFFWTVATTFLYFFLCLLILDLIWYCQGSKRTMPLYVSSVVKQQNSALSSVNASLSLLKLAT